MPKDTMSLQELFFKVASNINVDSFGETVKANTETQSLESFLPSILYQATSYLNKEAYGPIPFILLKMGKKESVTMLSFLSDEEVAKNLSEQSEHLSDLIVTLLEVENPSVSREKIRDSIQSLADTISAISGSEEVKKIIESLPAKPTPKEYAEALEKFKSAITADQKIMEKTQELALSFAEVLIDNPSLAAALIDRIMPDEDQLVSDLKNVLASENPPLKETTALEIAPKKQEPKAGLLGWVASKMHQEQATVMRKDLAELFNLEAKSHLNDTAGKTLNTPLQARLKSKDLSTLTLNGMDFKGFNIIGFNFASSYISNTSFDGSFIKDCNFTNAKFNENVDFTNCIISKESFMSMIPALKAAREAGIKVNFSGTRISGNLFAEDFIEQIQGLNLNFDKQTGAIIQKEESVGVVTTKAVSDNKAQKKPSTTLLEDKDIEAAFSSGIKLASDLKEHLQYDKKDKETLIGKSLLRLLQLNRPLKEKLKKFPVVAKIIKTRTIKQIFSIVFSIAVKNLSATTTLARVATKLSKAEITPEFIKNKLAKAGVKGIKEAFQAKSKKPSATTSTLSPTGKSAKKIAK